MGASCVRTRTSKPRFPFHIRNGALERRRFARSGTVGDERNCRATTARIPTVQYQLGSERRAVASGLCYGNDAPESLAAAWLRRIPPVDCLRQRGQSAFGAWGFAPE